MAIVGSGGDNRAPRRVKGSTKRLDARAEARYKGRKKGDNNRKSLHVMKTKMGMKKKDG
jgi:hypothetical protein